MFAVLPPELQGPPTLLLLALLVAVVVLLYLAFGRRSLRRYLRFCFAGMGLVSLVILLLFMLLPPVAKIRLYHQGHDQFYWGRRLHSDAAHERQEGAIALAALLKSNKSTARVFVIQELEKCEPEEREIALEALRALAKDENESEFLRWRAENAIAAILFQMQKGTHLFSLLKTIEHESPNLGYYRISYYGIQARVVGAEGRHLGPQINRLIQYPE